MRNNRIYVIVSALERQMQNGPANYNWHKTGVFKVFPEGMRETFLQQIIGDAEIQKLRPDVTHDSYFGAFKADPKALGFWL